jgi:hypothetical protein
MAKVSQHVYLNNSVGKAERYSSNFQENFFLGVDSNKSGLGRLAFMVSTVRSESRCSRTNGAGSDVHERICRPKPV